MVGDSPEHQAHLWNEETTMKRIWVGVAGTLVAAGMVVNLFMGTGQKTNRLRGLPSSVLTWNEY